MSVDWIPSDNRILGLEDDIRDVFAINGVSTRSGGRVIVFTGQYLRSPEMVYDAITDPGDEVIIPSPCRPSYPEMAALAGATPVFVETREVDGFVPDPEALADAVTKRSKVLILNSPTNPTGAVYSEAQLRRLAEIVVRHGLFVISDETYERFVYGGRSHSTIVQADSEFGEHAIVVHSFSKTYAMSGWRLGYVAARELKECPFCGGEMAQIEDTVDTIVRKAIELGIEVEVVKGSAALEEAGNIGAVLRY